MMMVPVCEQLKRYECEHEGSGVQFQEIKFRVLNSFQQFFFQFSLDPRRGRVYKLKFCLSVCLSFCTSSLRHFQSGAFKSSQNHVRPNTLCIIGKKMTSAMTMTMTKTQTKTNTNTKTKTRTMKKTKCLKVPSHAIFWLIFAHNIRVDMNNNIRT